MVCGLWEPRSLQRRSSEHQLNHFSCKVHLKSTVVAEMGLRLREFDIKPDNVSVSDQDKTRQHLLLDTDWLQKQYSKKHFVFNVLCIGNFNCESVTVILTCFSSWWIHCYGYDESGCFKTWILFSISQGLAAMYPIFSCALPASYRILLTNKNARCR